MPLPVRRNPSSGLIEVLIVAVGGLYLISMLGKSADDGAAGQNPAAGGPVYGPPYGGPVFGPPFDPALVPASGVTTDAGRDTWARDPLQEPLAYPLSLTDVDGGTLYLIGARIVRGRDGSAVAYGGQVVSRILFGLIPVAYRLEADNSLTSMLSGGKAAITEFVVGGGMPY